MASYTAGLPESFAALWLNRNVNRFRGPLGDATRRFSRAEVAFPGAPASVWIGFCSGATEYENTGALINGQVANPLFCETSFYGNESGPTFIGTTAASCRARRTPFAQCTFGPVPNPDPAAPFSLYARFATNEMIRRADMLGRNASLARGACFNVVEGTAVAMLNLRWHGHMVASLLPAAVRPSRPDTLWGVLLAFGAWSGGDARMAALVRPYAATLGALPEAARPAVLAWLVARDALARRLAVTVARSYANFAFLLLRCLQKIGAGEAVEGSANGGARSAWYRTGLVGAQRAAVLDVLARAAYGVALVPTDIGPAPTRVPPAGDLWMPAGIVLSPPPVAVYHAEELDKLVARAREADDTRPFGLEFAQSYGKKTGPKYEDNIPAKGRPKAAAGA